MDFLTYSIIVGGMIICIGFGLMSGYYICLRNHRLIKGEYEMFDKPKCRKHDNNEKEHKT